jgi:hypothetical protein
MSVTRSGALYDSTRRGPYTSHRVRFVSASRLRRLSMFEILEKCVGSSQNVYTCIGMTSCKTGLSHVHNVCSTMTTGC